MWNLLSIPELTGSMFALFMFLVVGIAVIIATIFYGKGKSGD
jgi:hypothetical protein